MSGAEPTIDGRPVLAPQVIRGGIGFAGPTRSLLQWIGRQLIAACMIPVGVAVGVLGILEDRWRGRPGTSPKS